MLIAQVGDTVMIYQQDRLQNIKPSTNYDSAYNVLRETEVSCPYFVIYKPKKPNAHKTGVLICPGGGYNILALDLEGSEVAQMLNKLGYAAIVLHYSVPHKRDSAFNDINRAFELLNKDEMKADLGIDRLGILGFSAGGHLCARASTRSLNSDMENNAFKPAFSVLIYPAYLNEGENNGLSPVVHVNKNTPPTFIFGTSDDRFATSALVYAQSLKQAELPFEMHILPTGGHGYGLREGNIAAQTWPKLLELWLANLLSK
jgi:acetyl esterase/lipase